MLWRFPSGIKKSTTVLYSIRVSDEVNPRYHLEIKLCWSKTPNFQTSATHQTGLDILQSTLPMNQKKAKSGELMWSDILKYETLKLYETPKRPVMHCNSFHKLLQSWTLRQVQGSGLWARLVSWSRLKEPIHPFRENSTGLLSLLKNSKIENWLEISCNVLESVGIHFQPCLA